MWCSEPHQRNDYDYDKKLKDSSKDINNLRAQIAALNGVTNDASIAKLARLRAELAEKEADREEMIRDHSIEMQSQGYDKLSQDAQDTLNDTLKVIEANSQKQEEVVNMMLSRLSDNYESAYNGIEEVISHTGTVIDQIAEGTVTSMERIKEAAENAKAALDFSTLNDDITDSINTATIDLQYDVSGVTGSNVSQIEADISAGRTEDKIDTKTNAEKSMREPTVVQQGTQQWVGELVDTIIEDSKKEISKLTESDLKKIYKKGYASGTLGTKRDELNWTHQGEIIRSSDGAILRQLPKGTQVIPRIQSENLMKWASLDPNKFFMKAMDTQTRNVEYQQTINNHYDTLLTVNGDVDREALPGLQEILRKACEYTNKVNARESRKLGMR